MVLAVIPARLASSRFPRKVLHPIQGKPLIWHVWKSVKSANQIDRVIVASSDKEILDVAREFGAETYRTSAKHQTGSDRSAEVCKSIPASIVVNVQADTFDLPSASLNRLVAFLKSNRAALAATLVYPISAQLAAQTDRVKVVLAGDNRALWFSRSPIPFPHQGTRSRKSEYFGHVGVYAYRRHPLLKFGSQKQTVAELTESLEQLRFLEMVGPMYAVKMTKGPRSIDRPEDLPT